MRRTNSDSIELFVCLVYIRNRVRSIFENKTRSTHKTVDNCWWNVCHRNPLNRLPEIIRKERDSS